MKRILASAVLSVVLVAGLAAEVRAQCPTGAGAGAGAGVGISFYCYRNKSCQQSNPCPPPCMMSPCPPMCGAPMPCPGWGGFGYPFDAGQIANGAAAAAMQGARAARGF